MSEKVSFTVDDVKAEQDNPWAEREDFHEEIDLEEIGASVIGFQEAAASASHGWELADRGSEATAEAGTLDSQTLIDAAEQSEETYQDLQGAGEGMSDAASLVAWAASLAFDTLEETDEEVADLEEQIVTESDAAVSGYNTHVGIVNSVFGAPSSVETGEGPVRQDGPVSQLAQVPTRYDGTYQDNAYYIVRNGSHLSGNLYQVVHDWHFDRAVEATEESAGAVDRMITDYRADLTDLAMEFEQYPGLEISDTGLGVWFTEQMAEYHAEKIAEAADILADDPDNTEAIALLNNSTSVLANLAEHIFYELELPRDGAELGAGRDYLEVLYDNLTVEQLAALGHLEDPRAHVAKQNLGNGMLMLLNPDIGGYDSSDRSNIPESVRTILFDTEIGGENAPGFDSPVGYDPVTGQLVVSGMYEYDGLAELFAHSTVMPGTSFAADLGESALSMQQKVNAYLAEGIFEDTHPMGRAGEEAFATTPDGDRIPLIADGILPHQHPVDVGASNMLDVTARSVDGSQQLLLDEENLRLLIGMDWQGYDDGAVAVLETATERVQSTEANARQAAEIAQNTMLMVGNEDERATWREMVPKDSAMNAALLGVAAEYIDALSGSPTANMEGVSTDSLGDGQFAGSFSLGGRMNGDLGFLDFVGTVDADATDEDFLTDPDFAILREAADQFMAGRLAEEAGSGRRGGLEQEAQLGGNLLGNLYYAESQGAMNYAEDAYQAAALVEARRQVFSNLVVDLAVAHPAGRAVSLGTEHIVSTEYKEAARAALNALVKPGVEGAKGGLSDFLDNVLGDGEKLDPNAAANELKGQMDAVYGNGRTSANYLIVNEFLRQEVIDRETLNDGGVSVDAIMDGDGLRPLDQILGDDEAMRAVNAAMTEVKVGGDSLSSDLTWDYVGDVYAPISNASPKDRGEVDGDLIKEIREGR